MTIRSMPPASAHLADRPVPAPPPTIGRPAATWARRRSRMAWRESVIGGLGVVAGGDILGWPGEIMGESKVEAQQAKPGGLCKLLPLRSAVNGWPRPFGPSVAQCPQARRKVASWHSGWLAQRQRL